MWADMRLGVIVGAIAIVLGSVAALLTSTPPKRVGNPMHNVAIAQPSNGRLAAGDDEVPPNDRFEDDRN
jgi:hypothetical protein